MADKYKKVPSKLKSSSTKPPFQLIIDICTKVHIEIPGLDSKIKCELTGIKQDNYLITTLPLLFDSSFVDKCNKADDVGIICRYVFKGIAYGFISNILGIVIEPIQIMVVGYPEGAEVCNIRRATKVAGIVTVQNKIWNSDVLCQRTRY